MSAGRPKSKLVVRLFRHAGRTLSYSMLFVFFVVVAVVLHVDIPVARRLAAKQLSDGLATLFEGKIVLDHVDDLGVSGMRGADAYVAAPDGTRVIVAHGLRAKIDPTALLRTLLAGKGVIGVFDIEIDDAEIVLDEDPKGGLKIARAFILSKPLPPPDGKKLPFRVDLASVHVKHVWIHGRITGAPLLDGDADNVRGEVHIEDTLRVDVSHVDVKTRALPGNANAVGVVTGWVAAPSPRHRQIGVGGTFEGLVGLVPTRGSLDFDEQEWRASVDVPQVDSAKVRALIPTAPLHGPLTMHAEASGPLSALLVHAAATVGTSNLDANALLALDKGIFVDAHLEATDVDLRSFAPSAPASHLGARADVELRAQNGEALHGSYMLTTPPGTLATESVPATDLRGTFQEASAVAGANGPAFTVTAVGKVLEPGAPTNVSLTFHPAKGGGTLDVDAHTVVPSLGGIRRIGFVGAGQADITTRGVVTFAATPQFDANVRAVVGGFRRDDLRVGHATIVGHAAGSFAAPAFQATLDATNVQEERFTWDHASATASGSASSIGVTVSAHGVETPSMEGRATVAIASAGAAATITDADITLRRRTTAMHARVGKVRIGTRLVAVENAELTGMGEPLRGSLANQGGVLTVQAQSAGLNLHDLAYLLRVDDHLKQGLASFALDLRTSGARAEGKATIAVTDLQWDAYQGIALDADVKLHGREIVGTASASMLGLGEAHVTDATIHLGGTSTLTHTFWSAREAQAAWRSSWGDVAVTGHVDIARAAALRSPGTLPNVTLAGTLDLTAHTSRVSPTDDAPLVVLSLQTRRLAASAVPTWELRGVDANVDVSVKGGTGKLTGSVTDALGTLFSFSAESANLPYAELLGPDPVSALLRQEMTAHVHVPPRELAALPRAVRPSAVRGFVQLDATATGTALAPVITLDAIMRGTTFPDIPDVKALDITTHGTYAAKAGDVTVDVSSAQEVYLHTRAHANADLSLFLRGKDDPGWSGSMHTTLLHFPIGAITQLSDRDVRGRVSGEVVLTRYHDDARATASVAADRLSIGRTRFSRAAVDAAFDGQTLHARVRLEEKEGFADATAKMAMVWGRALVPKPTPLGALSVAITARHLQASFLEPLLSSTVDELDGIIDGDARVELALGVKPSMSGNILLRDGRVIPSATGEELHGINAKVTLAEDGTLSLTDMVAMGTTGKVTGMGTAHLTGLSLTDAALKLAIAKKDALPLSLGGSVLGTGYGNLTLGAAKSGAASTKVTIDIPDFHVELPEATPRNVQDLSPPPDNIHVGVRTGTGDLRPIGKTRSDIVQKRVGESPQTLEIAVHLGAVELSRGSDLRAVLGGNTTMTVADKNTMRGQITLRSGRLTVQGKPFEIQKGTATFVGDPQNPEVNVTASWKANDGTEVFADYIGPLKTGKVTLRSEPPRPQNEIVALILFGTSDGAQSTPYAQQQQTDTTTAVGSAVGGFATGGLNKGIDKLTGMDISTKIDTSQANPRPEVELRIARDLSLQLAFVLGTPPPGTNQDTTYATIDWRFYRNWSLATTFGNLGSSIADVLWRYRY